MHSIWEIQRYKEETINMTLYFIISFHYYFIYRTVESKDLKKIEKSYE